MPVACATCPFSGAHRPNVGAQAHADFTDSLVNMRSQHLCHTVNNKKICRGGRDLQLKVLVTIGILPEPTDAAFNRKLDEVMNHETI